jgi:hypothetical protein
VSENSSTAIKAKWTRNATKRFGGWSDSGKTRWNALMVESRERWYREKPEGMGMDDYPKARFVKDFEDRWFLKHGLKKRGENGALNGVNKMAAVHEMVLSIEEL